MDTLLAAFAAWLSFLTAQGTAPEAYLNAPATPAQIAAAEQAINQRFTADLTALYRRANGEQEKYSLKDPSPAKYFTNVFGGYRFLSIEEAVHSWQGWMSICTGVRDCADYNDFITVRDGHAVRRTYFHTGWLPIAEDGGGNAWAIDLDPPPGGVRGQIIQMGPDEDERRVIAPSLTALFVGAAKHIDPDNVHVSACCGPHLVFNMDWKEPPALSPAEQFERARRSIRKPRINLQIQAFRQWLTTQPDSAQASGGVDHSGLNTGLTDLHRIMDTDGAYRLCAAQHDAVVAMAIFRARHLSPASEPVGAAVQTTRHSYGLVHRWLLDAGFINPDRFAQFEAMRLNESGVYDAFIEEAVTRRSEFGYTAQYDARCTVAETISLMLTWPYKRFRGFLYEWRSQREADASRQ